MVTRLPKTDVVIVGGGWTGLTAASELCHAGLRCVILERGQWRHDSSSFAASEEHDELEYALRSAHVMDTRQQTLTFRINSDQLALPMRRLGSFLPGQGLGFNTDNFDHSGRGFVGGGYISSKQYHGPPIAWNPVPEGVPGCGAEWKRNVRKYDNSTADGLRGAGSHHGRMKPTRGNVPLGIRSPTTGATMHRRACPRGGRSGSRTRRRRFSHHRPKRDDMTRTQATRRTHVLAVFSAAALGATATHAAAQEGGAPQPDETPAAGYLEAHRGVQEPLPLLGGPIEVTLEQDGGRVFVGLPDNRELDETIFGTPERPLAYGGFPIVMGVPVAMRGTEDGAFTELQQKSPFGNAHLTLPGAELELTAVDATAADAATSDDSVEMTASWQDEEGNTYTVRCCERLQTAGVEHPTFGGVVTNHLMHGFSGVGTPLMPTMVAYLGFWGAGEILKNGEVIDGPRPVHGMLTEYVRTGAYELGFDENVTPTARHFHVMVAPVVPGEEPGALQQQPVETGFTLPNGQPLPFWHVMFENVDVGSERQEG